MEKMEWMKLMKMHHSNILEHREQLLNEIKSGKSVNRKELQDKYNYWLREYELWSKKDKENSTELTLTSMFECGCRNCTYRMALEFLDKLEGENPKVKIVQEQDGIGQYKFDFWGENVEVLVLRIVFNTGFLAGAVWSGRKY